MLEGFYAEKISFSVVMVENENKNFDELLWASVQLYRLEKV